MLLSQPQNMLKSIINTAMIPNEEKAYLKNAGKRIFSMVVLGLENVNTQNDSNIHYLLRNLFDQYLPILVTKVSNNFTINEVLLNCFTDTKDLYLKKIFDVLTSFIIVPSDNTTHKHCYLVMILLTKLVLDKSRCSSTLLQIMVSSCVSSVINCFMKVSEMHPHRKQTTDLFRALFQNIHYINSPAIKDIFENIITVSIYKYISVNSSATFALLNILVALNVNLVLKIFPKIQQIIAENERNRKPNLQSLKCSFQKLKDSIKQHSKL